MNDTQQSRLNVEVTGAVARVTLNNPPLNIIDIQTMDELAAALADLERRPLVSTIVFAGSERAFSAGVDIPAHEVSSVAVMLRKFHVVIRSMAVSRKLLVAVVRRHCLGGAAELALMCDIVFASTDAVFAFPEIKLAAFPPVAMAALSAVVGQKRAAELILTARSLTATEALEIGLVNGVADDPEALLTECLSRVQQLSPAALAVAKKAFYAWDAVHFDKGLARAEQIYMDELMKTDDAKEGIRAYIEKRRPRWTGK
ncbi:MAG TPA: enoyl-CoA hydratase/isomerase family protein [Clostridia bacterium]|nr:enoyl-CoA hydratase/isomerase family protein [Clostridia bacterium]